jgi:hypothetical protein
MTRRKYDEPPARSTEQRMAEQRAILARFDELKKHGVNQKNAAIRMRVSLTRLQVLISERRKAQCG